MVKSQFSGTFTIAHIDSLNKQKQKIYFNLPTLKTKNTDRLIDILAPYPMSC
jgi:hypothetical protein